MKSVKSLNSMKIIDESRPSVRRESSEGEGGTNKEEDETLEQRRVKLFQNLKALQVMFLKRRAQERELEKIESHANARQVALKALAGDQRDLEAL
jgi:hypothetical protein